MSRFESKSFITDPALYINETDKEVYYYRYHITSLFGEMIFYNSTIMTIGMERPLEPHEENPNFYRARGIECFTDPMLWVTMKGLDKALYKDFADSIIRHSVGSYVSGVKVYSATLRAGSMYYVGRKSTYSSFNNNTWVQDSLYVENLHDTRVQETILFETPRTIFASKVVKGLK